MKKEIEVLGTEIRVSKIDKEDYICITDIAKQKNSEFPADVVKNWLKTKFAIEFLGIWEQMHNSNFKLVDFYQFKNEAGSNAFVLSPKRWIKKQMQFESFQNLEDIDEHMLIKI